MMMRTLLRTLAVGLAVATLASSAPSHAAEWRSFTPTSHAGETNMLVDAETFVYYRFTSEEPLVFSVEGPTRIKLLTRLRLANDVDSDDYTLVVSRDGQESQRETFEGRHSSHAHYVAFTPMGPGQLRRLYIDVPTGLHGYEIRTEGTAVVDARPFERAGDEPSRVALAPISSGGVETFLYRDRELVYYLATKREPVVLEVVGPTAVKVNTRLLFDETMLSDQVYVVGVTEDAGPEKLYKIETESSETVVCRDRERFMVGSLQHFMLEVDEGPHTYSFRLVDSVSDELGIKFYIPRGDVTNEP
jgi:hypothetical protein